MGLVCVLRKFFPEHGRGRELKRPRAKESASRGLDSHACHGTGLQRKGWPLLQHRSRTGRRDSLFSLVRSDSEMITGEAAQRNPR